MLFRSTVATYTATDADGGASLSYSIASGADKLLFAIDSSTGALTFSSAPDYDSGTACNAGNTCVVVIRASDGVNTDDKQITVTLTDANDQTPTFTSGSTTLSVAEGSSASIDSFSITDTDTVGTLACAESGNDADDFACDISGGTLTITWSATPDYDSPADSDNDNIYTYTITVGDGTNDAAAVTYTVTVTDTNEAPKIGRAHV